MLLNSENSKNLQRIIRFFSRKNETGYIFAYAKNSAMIPDINQETIDFFQINSEKIGLLFLKNDNDQSILQQLSVYLANQNYKALIVANLYDYIAYKSGENNHLSEINFSREAFYEFNIPILFWISEATFHLIANDAPDLYSQRRLPTLIFEDEVTSVPIQMALPSEELLPPTTSTNLELLAEQFNSAVKQQMPVTKLINNYLLPYMLELSKNFDKTAVNKLFKQYKNKFDLTNINILTNLGDIFANINEYGQALEYYSKVIRDNKNKDFPTLLFKRGDLLNSMGKLQDALKDYQQAYRLLKILCNKLPNNIDIKNKLAISCERLGTVHSALENLTKALQYFKNTTKIFTELYSKNLQNILFKNSLAISYSKLGETHAALGNLEHALKFFQERLNLSKELYESNSNNVTFKNGLAVSYERLGETHAALGNLEQALKFFQDETNLFRELYESNSNNVTFKNALAVSYSKLGETHAALGNLEQALKFFQDDLTLTKELYKSNSNNITFKNGLAVSYAKLGEFYRDHKNDRINAYKYFKVAQQLWQELSDKSPIYIKFQKSYQKINQNLNILNNS